MNWIKEFIYRLRGEYTTEKLVSMGMQVGKNFKRLNGVILDSGHSLLTEIGNNVTCSSCAYFVSRLQRLAELP